MKSYIQFPISVSDRDSPWLIGPFEKSIKYNCDESDAVRRAFKSLGQIGTLLDVGAHRGTVSIPFLKDGWRVLAFEPDPDNYWHLRRRVNVLRQSYAEHFEHIPCAVSEKEAHNVSFYKSSESSGVSSLSSFLDSHTKAFGVTTNSLTNLLSERGIDQCDFLKTDIEGHDFFALKGFPWHVVQPPIVACEIEDRKTIPLGYSWKDLAEYLREQNYNIFVSEWHPIERYGVDHSWMGVKEYPCELEDEKSWGNIIAFRRRSDRNAILNGLIESASGFKQLHEVAFKGAFASDYAPSNSHDVYLTPDKEAFFREGFSGQFLPGGCLVAKFEFEAPAGSKLLLRLWREGKAPKEHVSEEVTTTDGLNTIHLKHEVKNLQFGFFATVHNHSNDYVVLRNFRVSIKYDDHLTSESAGSAHPMSRFIEGAVYHDYKNREVFEWNQRGLGFELSHHFRSACNAANPPEDRELAWLTFVEMAMKNSSLLTYADWQAVQKGLAATSVWEDADSQMAQRVPLNEALKRHKPDGVQIYDLPDGEDLSEVASIKIMKTGRYRLTCKFMAMNCQVKFYAIVNGGDKIKFREFTNQSFSNETIFIDALKEGDELQVRAQALGEGAKIFSASLEALKDLRMDKTTKIQMRTSVITRNLPKESVLHKAQGLEEIYDKDIERLQNIQGRYKGERIFILGNGPSLNKTPLEMLENEYVFGVNRIGLLLDRVRWRPTFYTAFDTRVVPDNAEEISNLDIPFKFFSTRYKNLLGEKINHYFHSVSANYDGFGHCFTQYVPYCGFGGGGTISVLAIQLAYFLGFREIYLIGMDATYKILPTVKQFGDFELGGDVKLQLTSTADDDPNHFDPRYFGSGKKWHNPNVEEMKIGFGQAAYCISQLGGVLQNATVGGALDEVERVEFESLFK